MIAQRRSFPSHAGRSSISVNHNVFGSLLRSYEGKDRRAGGSSAIRAVLLGTRSTTRESVAQICHKGTQPSSPQPCESPLPDGDGRLPDYRDGRRTDY